MRSKVTIEANCDMERELVVHIRGKDIMPKSVILNDKDVYECYIDGSNTLYLHEQNRLTHC